MSVAHLNRAQRRAAVKATKAKPSRHARRFGSAQDAVDYLFKPIALLHDCRQIEASEATNDFLRIRLAFDALRDGSAESSHYTLLWRAVMIAGVRALSIAPERLTPIIEAGMAALSRCKERFKKHGRYGFDGQGMQDLITVIDLNEQIVLNSTRQELIKASNAVDAEIVKAIKKKSQNDTSSYPLAL